MIKSDGNKRKILQKLFCLALVMLVSVSTVITAMAQTSDAGVPVLESIEVISAPEKNVYSPGESFDQTGLEVVAHYTGDMEDKVLSEEEYILRTPDMNTEGTKKVSIVYAEGEITKETSFDISVYLTGDPVNDVSSEDNRFDKNSKSEGNKDIVFYTVINNDKLNKIALITDQDGEEVLSYLKQNTDYTVSEDQKEITIKKDYLANLAEGENFFEFQFASESKRVKVNIVDSTLVEQQKPSIMAPVANSGNYQLSLDADSILKDAEYFNLVTQTNGNLSISVSLPSGETGRYIDVYLPNYGFALGSPLPSVDGNITEVVKETRSVEVAGTTQAVEYVRLFIADSVDTTLNIHIPYKTKPIGALLDIAWGMKGTLPQTGFEVNVYNGAGTLLASEKCGNWKPENVQGKTPVEFKFQEFQSGSSSLGYHIGNYPDIGYTTTKGGYYRFNVTVKNAYYSNEYGTTYSKETPYKLKVYVPDPTLIEVTNISGGGLTSFEDATLQTDGTNWWYELENDSWTDPKASSTLGSYGQGNSTSESTRYQIGVSLKKVSGAEIAPGTEFQVKPVELTVRGYGEDDVTVYTASWTPKMREVQDNTSLSRQNSFVDYYGGETVPSTGNGGTSAQAFVVDLGTTDNTSRVIQDTDSGIVSGDTLSSDVFIYYDYLYPVREGSTEEWTFPFEIQPTGLTYYLVSADVNTNTSIGLVNYNHMMSELGVSNISDLIEVYYQTSDGNKYLASLNIGGNNNKYLYMNFDQIPENERVVSATITWKKWVVSHSNFQVHLNYSVATNHEDGSTIAGGEKFQVKHIWKNSNSEIVANSDVAIGRYTHIWFVARPERCPELYWVNDNVGTIPTVLMSNEDRYVSKSILKVPDEVQDKDAPSYRDTMADPQLKIGVTVSGNSSVYIRGWADDIQTNTQFLTGKMTVMPFLAGWTITYHTVNKGEQTYTLPNDIPEEGLEIQIPLDEGDRFDKVIVFSKQGDVSGWDTYPELIKNIEYTYWRDNVDGQPIISTAYNKEMAEEGYYDVNISTYLCFGDCDGTYGNHQGTDDIYGTQNCNIASGGVLSDFIYNYVLEISPYRTTKNPVSLNDVYQGNETTFTIDSSTRLYVQNKSEIRSMQGLIELANELYGTNGRNTGTILQWRVALPYHNKPVFYVELLNPEVIYDGSPINSEFGAQPIVNSTVGVEYLQLEDNSTWLKITPDEMAETIGTSRTTGSSSDAISLSDWNIETVLYALPGAATGQLPVIGDVYLDLHVEETTQRFDGTDSEYPNLVYRFSGTVADERGLLGDGDTTTPRLFQLNSDEININIMQHMLAGVSLIPGSSDQGLATDARVVNVFNHDTQGLRTLVTIGSENEDLENYEVIIEVPKEGKDITGIETGNSAEETVTSQFDIRLTQEPEIASNTTTSAPQFSYRLVGESTWISADQVSDWGQVDAIKVNLDEVKALSVLNLNLYMEMDKQSEDGISSYIGGSYSYMSSSGQTSRGTINLGKFVYNTYKISGNVWYDPNENGSQSGTKEINLEGITVEVKRTADNSVVATAKTDAKGLYSFELTEGEGLYLEVNLPEGYKLTKQSIQDHTVTAADSDFDRRTNRFNMPEVMRNGTYTNISAGLVKLPTLTVDDITVTVGETLQIQPDVEWDYGKATVHYEEANDTAIATVTTDGIVSGVKPGKTTATAWVENTLGDRVEVTYDIIVSEELVEFTLSKSLTEIASEDETFVFMISGNGSTFYTTLTVTEGNSSASIKITGLEKGSYTVTELDSNWRYENTGNASQTIELNDINTAYSCSFTNEKMSDQWLSNSVKVVNTMTQNP